MLDKFNLKDKIAIITGGGSGLGLEMSKTLARYEAKVVIADVRKEEGANAAISINKEVGTDRAIPIQTDVSEKESVHRMVEEVLRQHKRIDILVNSAGINIRKAFVEYEEDEWDKILNVNLKGVFLCCQEVGKVMIRQQKGKIINISSALEKIGQEHRGPYAASKGGVSQLTKVLAIEWAPYHININCIAPGFMKTPLISKVIEQDSNFYSYIKQVVPMGHIGNPEDLEGAVLLLASEASNYITGQSIFVDGGWSIW